jgi:hypothetical protein
MKSLTLASVSLILLLNSSFVPVPMSSFLMYRFPQLPVRSYPPTVAILIGSMYYLCRGLLHMKRAWVFNDELIRDMG